MKHFLQSVLKLEINDLEILEGKKIHKTTEETNPEAEVIAQIFYTEIDVLVKLSDGSKVIVEVQVEPIKDFMVRRLLLYSAKEVIDDFEHIRSEMKKTYSVYPHLKPVYTVSILEYHHFNDKNPIHDFTFKDQYSETRYTDADGKELQRHVFLELKKFSEASQVEKNIKNWFQFWANVSIDPTADPVILEADELELDEKKWSLEVKDMITREALREETAKAKLYYATENARQQGLEQGLRQVALKLLKGGFSVEDVSENTGLSLEAIKQLKAGEIKSLQ